MIDLFSKFRPQPINWKRTVQNVCQSDCQQSRQSRRVNGAQKWTVIRDSAIDINYL